MTQEKTVVTAPENDANGASTTPIDATAGDFADEVSEQYGIRLAKRERLDAAGVGAYPVSVPVTHTIAAIRAAHPDLPVDAHTGELVGLAGRVVHQRNTGKLCFVVLQGGDGSRIQGMISLGAVGADSLAEYKELVDLGDHLFLHGEVITSKRGELSVFADSWQIASKALRPLPTLHKELSEEARVRTRYLDLIAREQAREMVRTRAAVMTALRTSLDGRGFIEIETPILQVMHGGATARPFVTHMNAYDIDVYLRIATELYLKRALIGGIEQVYEINRDFRNEGADSTHSPEFAMLEAYEAYGDYTTIGRLTQDLIQAAAAAVSGGSQVVTWADGTAHDYSGEWDRISLFGSLSEAIGREITPETPLDELAALADDAGVEVAHPIHGKYVEELWEHYVKPNLVRPTFVLDFPVDTSPLTRQHRSKPGVVEKWDLYVRGFELATGYSELADPVIQRARFVEQARQAAAGDDEAMHVDEDFLTAMEYGMPPAGGMGMGIDRLLMALTGLGIRETILFPLVK